MRNDRPARVFSAPILLGFACLLAGAVPSDKSGAAAGSSSVTPDTASRGIRIDHTCVSFSAIPEKAIPAAASLRVLMRHASVGDGINWGLDTVAGKRTNQPIGRAFASGKYNRSKWVLENRGNPGWRAKVDDLVKQTASRTNEFDVFMMKFCYIDALGKNQPDWEYYRTAMEKLEADYPKKKLVWWTIPLTRDGQPGTDAFNAQVRSYCTAKGKIVFDIADIECYDTKGVRLSNSAGNEVISSEYTREIHAGHLNPEGRVRVAAALWHLMVRIAVTGAPSK